MTGCPARQGWRGLLALLVALPSGTLSPALAAGGTVTYTYDALGRLTQVSNPNGTVVTYGLDAAGNRTNVTTIPPPGAPGTPTISAITYSTATATWTAPTSGTAAAGYKYTLNGGASWQSVATTTASLSSLTASKQYTFSVLAYDAAGGQGPTSSATFTTATPPPSTPTGLIATVAGNNQVNLSWSASTDSGGPGLAGYHIYRGGTLIATSASTSYSDTGVSPFNTYAYAVAAYDTQGRLSGQASVSASTFYQITNSTGTAISPASSLYSAITTSSGTAPFKFYTWTVTQLYGTHAIVVQSAPTAVANPPPCTQSATTLASGYQKNGCVIEAEPSVYGH